MILMTCIKVIGGVSSKQDFYKKKKKFITFSYYIILKLLHTYYIFLYLTTYFTYTLDILFFNEKMMRDTNSIKVYLLVKK